MSPDQSRTDKLSSAPPLPSWYLKNIPTTAPPPPLLCPLHHFSPGCLNSTLPLLTLTLDSGPELSVVPGILCVKGSGWSEFPGGAGVVRSSLESFSTHYIFHVNAVVRWVHLRSASVELLRGQEAQTTGSGTCISIFKKGFIALECLHQLPCVEGKSF